jgi:hypothetical protein
MKVSDLHSPSAEILDEHLRGFNVPVLCENTLVYTEPDGRQLRGVHAFVLMGVRSVASGKKEFMIRDSNLPDAYWMELRGCERAWAIE